MLGSFPPLQGSGGFCFPFFIALRHVGCGAEGRRDSHRSWERWGRRKVVDTWAGEKTVGREMGDEWLFVWLVRDICALFGCKGETVSACLFALMCSGEGGGRARRYDRRPCVRSNVHFKSMMVVMSRGISTVASNGNAPFYLCDLSRLVSMLPETCIYTVLVSASPMALLAWYASAHDAFLFFSLSLCG